MLLKSCCCGCSLQTGTKIIAILIIIHSIMGLIRVLTVDRTVEGASTEIAIIVPTSVVNILLAGFLLSAITQNKSGHLLPWLVVSAIEFVATPIGLIYFAVIFSLTGHWVSVGLFLGIGIPITVLEIYCWLVVYSYYKEINLAKNDKSREKGVEIGVLA